MPSRSSSASSPSSAASSGSNRIDLGKDSGVDMGSKSQVSSSSGGIGITQEITTIGGLQIEGGVSVDVSPLDLEISSNGKDKISIGASAEIPGGLLGIGGGITIDTATGQVKGGSVSGEIGGFGVEISKSEDGFGLGISYQIPFSPISINIGFGEKKLTPTPTPTPTPVSSPANWDRPVLPVGDPGKSCTVIVAIRRREEEWRGTQLVYSYEYEGAGNYTPPTNSKSEVLDATQTIIESIPFGLPSDNPRLYPNTVGIWGYDPSWQLFAFNRIGNTSNPNNGIYQPDGIVWGLSGREDKIFNLLDNGVFLSQTIDYGWMKIVRKQTYLVIHSSCSLPSPSPSPSPSPLSPSPPNPPPRKEMDECCRESMRMLRNLSTVMQVDNVLKGKVQIPGELLAIPEEGKTLPPEILQTYPQMVNAILLAVNRHGMDAPITVEIEDTDKTTAGDQSASYTYNSPGVAMQAVLEMLHELKAAGNARLSIQIGIAFAVTRILKTVAGASESIREIIKMLGMPFRYKPKKMQLEFNLSGIKKGYGKDSKPKELAEMSKEELENIIPTLLEGSECDIPVPTFTPSEADDLRQMLCKLTIRKEK